MKKTGIKSEINMKTRIYILSIFLAIISACQVQETDFRSTIGEVTFLATSGDVPMSKTTLQADGAIWWNPNDEINIFYGDAGNYKFTSTNTSTAPDVEFKGSLKYEEGKDEYWAVYPYSSENTFDGSSIKVSLPSEQYAVKDSFKDDLFISIAKTTDQNLTFYNVCGGVKFSVAQPGVTSVVFKGNNNEILAGTASVSFDSEGKPFVNSVSDGKTEITVSTENGDSFEVGAWYYIVAFPEKLTSGYTMTFTLAGASESVKTNSNPVTIKRSIWGILKDVDTSLESDIPEAVDLGLSVKWASCNVGASKPEDSGNYYAWGETETKNDFSWLNYKWSVGSNRSLTKYNTKSDYGVVDYKIALDIEDDVAHVVLGGDWRMPTYTEIEELIKECNWQMETVNGVNGFRVLGPNGNSIFLPVSDKEHNPPSGTYWSSTGQNGSARTFWFIFRENLPSHIRLFSQGSSAPYMGNVVRPVNKAFIPISGISLDQSSIPLKNGASQKLTATILPDDATNKTVTWASSDTTVATVSSKGIIVSLKAGTTNITAYSADGNQSSSCEVTVYDPISTPEAIDLGLSVKWSSSNIGAYYIGDIGESYEWGNIEPFNGYQYEDKFNPSGDKVTYTKYTGNDYDTLQPEDDAAHVLLGEKWRIPTREEWKELMDKDNCDWTWGSANGQNGYYVTSRINGNSIFLPDRDSRIQPSYLPTSFYWSSSLYVENPSYAFSFNFSNDSKHIAASYVRCTDERRYYDFLIRPVYGDYAAEIPVTGVSLNKTSIELVEGESFTLVATVEPAEVTDKTVIWTSSDTSVATVSNGVITATAVGTAIITASVGGKTSSCTVTVTQPISMPEAVDLGLSVKWASYNLGAFSPQPEDYGGYYAWGETEVKTNHSGWDSYKWSNGSDMKLTKYCPADLTYNYWDGDGVPEGKTVLEPEDDAAYEYLGHNWRIPTNEEWTELIEKCTWTWTNNYIGTGVKGMIVEGSNGNSIFLPAAGGQGMPHSDGEAEYAGDYWSSSLNTMEPDRAYYVYFDSSGVRSYSAGIRCFGFSVRPVSE